MMTQCNIVKTVCTFLKLSIDTNYKNIESKLYILQTMTYNIES